MPRPPDPRSPYWRPGMDPGSPWAAVAQTNLGLYVVLTGADQARAGRIAQNWRRLAQEDQPIAPESFAVGAAMVNPDGRTTWSWGQAPTPMGGSRWAPIMRLEQKEPLSCMECGRSCWTGTWVAVDLHGCGVCLSVAERTDPRRWPADTPALGVRPRPLGVASPRRSRIA